MVREVYEILRGVERAPFLQSMQRHSLYALNECSKVNYCGIPHDTLSIVLAMTGKHVIATLLFVLYFYTNKEGFKSWTLKFK